MAIERRERKPKPGEDRRRKHYAYRVKWRLGGGRGPQQGFTVASEQDAKALERAVAQHGYPASSDPMIQTLSIIGAKRAQQQPRAASAVTLRDAIIAFAARATLAPRTAASYRQVIGMLGEDADRYLASLDTEVMHAIFLRLQGRYADKTMRRARITVHGALVRHGYGDLMGEIRYLGTRVVRPRYLSRSQVEALADCGDRYGIGTPIRLVAETGLRWGEMAGLQTFHVLASDQALDVAQSIPPKGMTAGGGWAPNRTKGKQERLVPMGRSCTDMMREHTAGLAPRAVVFRPERSGWWTHPVFMSRWHRATEDALAYGVPEGVRFHDLRHTAAKHMLEHGVHLGAVSEVLGHSDVSVTASIYAGIDQNTHNLVRAAFD